jgi:hypothetical protein
MTVSSGSEEMRKGAVLTRMLGLGETPYRGEIKATTDI